MLYGSLLTGMSMTNTRLGGAHGLAHPLGYRYHIPHGVVCGLLLPYVMEHSLEYAPGKYAQVARLLGVDTAAMSAQEALSLLEEITPDIILTDIMMPEIDGISLIRELRARSAWSSIPALVVTAKGRHEVAIEAQNAGANGFITKPFSLKQLKDAMAPYLKPPDTNGDSTA